MSEIPASDPPKTSNPIGAQPFVGRKRIVLFLVCFVIIGAILFFLLRSKPDVTQASSGEVLITVDTIEVAKATKEGKAWDPDNSGPDVYFEIWWQGTMVFKSTIKPDTLIAHWETQEIDLMKMLRTRRVEASSNGAIINAKVDPEIIIKVRDSDVLQNDAIDEYKINVRSLKKGKNELGPSPLKHCLKLVVLLIPASEE